LIPLVFGPDAHGPFDYRLCLVLGGGMFLDLFLSEFPLVVFAV
jgi:hypothetical protein